MRLEQLEQVLGPALVRAGVRVIAIVDDAYDPPTLEKLGGNDAAEEFFHAVLDDDARVADLARFDVELRSPADVNDALLARLFEKRDEFEALRQPWEDLIRGWAEASKGAVERLREILAQLDVEVVALGRRAAEGGEVPPADLLFMDYYLGDEVEADAASRAASQMILTDFKNRGEDPPVFVLMSSRAVRPDEIETFRAGARILGGMYQFVEKAELERPETLCLRLVPLLNSAPEGRRISRFVDAIEDTAETAVDAFTAQLRALTLADYAHIELLALQGDGQPLGDYMIWLFSTALGDAVFDRPELVEVQRDIDTMRFESLPPRERERVLSPVLANMYHRAQFRRIADPIVGPHPRDTRDVPPPEEIDLHLGDLFMIPGGIQVWAVISPECDLAFSPPPGRRQFRGERSIALMPGTLNEIDGPQVAAARTGPRTEVFEHAKRIYRIMWETKHVLSFPRTCLPEWIRDGGKIRPYRLRTPFALDLQRAYAADLQRIGVPVPPPFRQHVSARLYAMNVEGQHEELILGPRDCDVVWYDDGGKERCVLSGDLVKEIVAVAPKAAEWLRERIASLEADGRKARTEETRRVDQLEALSKNVEEMLKLRGPHDMPRSGKTNNATSLLCIGNGIRTDVEYQHQRALLLHLMTILEDDPEPNHAPAEIELDAGSPEIAEVGLDPADGWTQERPGEEEP